jgi:glutaredoxin
MNKKMTNQEIDKRIGELKTELENVRGRETEVYSRIVGYYRAVKNWNRGKREEYNHRVTYTYPSSMPGTSGTIRSPLSAGKAETGVSPGIQAISSYQYFYRTTCPNCPPVKSYLEGLGYQGSEINVDMDEGFTLAGKLAICATPTVIFRDSDGSEILRVSNLHELIKAFEAEQAVS